MRKPQPQRIDDLFQRAVLLPHAQQPAFLDHACPDDATLRAEVEELLKHDEQAPPGFLAPPQGAPTHLVAGDGSELHAAAQDPDPLIGTNIGGCLITAHIARGGMGTVYEAIQQHPRRKVAVKVLNPHVVSPSGLRRFQLESQILAHLHHPNIAQVHEAGTHHTNSPARTACIPYFVMEYVSHAEPITQYARQRTLSTRDRLKLFAKVCDAVHHGHLKGVIHRDLKPGNILVDADGEPKVIDFGVARSTDIDVAITTMRTDVGQLIGTLQYMSPEQCAGNAHDIDTRSDVFSLGVVLYELLCDRPPFDIAGVPIFEATRIIRDHTPERPSTINRALRGDIETIALKAMEKDRENRYQSAAALAKDIRRHLNREPIEARPPTGLTRIFHCAARHPAITTTGVCLFIAAGILAGTSAATYLYNFRPYKLVLAKNGEQATLFAFNGRELKTWAPDEPRDGRVSMAKLVPKLNTIGGKRLAILGFANAYGATQFLNSLCAFDIDEDLQNPLWVRQIEDEDLPEALRRERNYIGASFGVTLGTVADVFAGSQFPGDEIIAIHQHESTTHSAVRVYDTSGTLLYQLWVDAYITSVYWIRDAQQLVLAGLNGAAFWGQRGYPDVVNTHATVVFAIRPTPGFVTREYLSETPGQNRLDPLWYNCLMPPRMSDVFTAAPLSLRRPGGEYNPGRTVLFSVATSQRLPWTNGDVQSGVTWVLDESGRVIPGSQNAGDLYKLHQSELPKLDDVYLGELPPIVSPAVETAPADATDGENRDRP